MLVARGCREVSGEGDEGVSEDGKHNHVMATDIVRLRSVDASKTNSMDQIAMCTMGKHGFRQS